MAIPPLHSNDNDSAQPARTLCIAAKNHCQKTLELALRHFPDATQHLITPIALNNHPPQLPLYYALQSLETLKKNKPLSYYHAQKYTAYKFIDILSKATLALLSPQSEDYTEIKAELNRLALPDFQQALENSDISNHSFRTLRFRGRTTTETMQDTDRENNTRYRQNRYNP